MTHADLKILKMNPYKKRRIRRWIIRRRIRRRMSRTWRKTCNNATADLGQSHLKKLKIRLKVTNDAVDVLSEVDNIQSHLPLVQRWSSRKCRSHLESTYLWTDIQYYHIYRLSGSFSCYPFNGFLNPGICGMKIMTQTFGHLKDICRIGFSFELLITFNV